MFKYEEHEEYFAVVQRGLEEIALEELEELGAESCRTVFCGVKFKADRAVLYKINYCVRTVSRILAPLVSFACHSEKVLYSRVKDIEWERLLKKNGSFAVFASVSGSKINHSHFASLKVKDAIADYFMDKHNVRPDVDKESPDLWVNLNIRDNKATISVDTSGGVLHKRGYRVDSVKAPLQETLAAAMLRISGWNGDVPFYDPMCGSGTILIEAVMKYCRIPAAFKREHFGFFQLPDFDKNIWKQVKAEADAGIIECPSEFFGGSDLTKRSVVATGENLRELPGDVWKKVRIKKRDFRDIESLENCVIVTNPPYGVRLGKDEEPDLLYKEFGDFLKKKCTGTTAHILCGSTALVKKIGLRVSKRTQLYNGSIETRLARVELY